MPRIRYCYEVLTKPNGRTISSTDVTARMAIREPYENTPAVHSPTISRIGEGIVSGQCTQPERCHPSPIPEQVKEQTVAIP